MVAMMSPLKEDNTGRGSRVAVCGSAAYLSPVRVLIARSADVSATGAFVSTTLPDPVGTKSFLRLVLEREVCVVECEVARVSFLSGPGGNGMGMGLRFHKLDKEQQRFLARYIAKNVN